MSAQGQAVRKLGTPCPGPHAAAAETSEVKWAGRRIRAKRTLGEPYYVQKANPVANWRLNVV
jgi:hypothetical protein